VYVLQSQTDQTLKSFNPIFFDNCLKYVGVYQSCVPLANGKLVVTCASSQQIKKLGQLHQFVWQQAVPVFSS